MCRCVLTIRPETNSNNFEVFGINYQIRIRLSSSRFFFERFEFVVCSKYNHTQCGRTCACAMACLHPHNSISNVVASLTIDDDIYIYIYVRDVAKNKKPLWKVKGFFNRTSWKVSDVQVVRYTWRKERKTNRTISQLVPSAVSLRRAGVEQLHLVKRMIGGIGNMLFSIYSQTENV